MCNLSPLCFSLMFLSDLLEEDRAGQHCSWLLCGCVVGSVSVGVCGGDCVQFMNLMHSSEYLEEEPSEMRCSQIVCGCV